MPRKSKTASYSLPAQDWLSQVKASPPREAGGITALLAATLEANIRYYRAVEENKRRKSPSTEARKKVATTLKRAADFIEAETTYPAFRTDLISHTADLLDAMLIARSKPKLKKQKAPKSKLDPGEVLARIEDAHCEIEITRAFLIALAKLVSGRERPPKDNVLASLFYDKFGISPPRRVTPTNPFVASLLLIWRSATGTLVVDMGIGAADKDAGRGPLMEFLVSASVPIFEVHGPTAKSLSPSALQTAAVELRKAARNYSDEVVEAQATINSLV